jgi:AcrR family transcriptional regulator
MSQTFDSVAEIHSHSQTKQRILDAAEHLFSLHGFVATSLRQITRDAKVNLAAINYHFQSKESLILAVLMRKIGPINRRRLELLDQLESTGQPLVLEDVLHAFFAPLFDARRAGASLSNFPKLMGRAYTEPGDWMQRLFPQAFAPVVSRFGAALRSALGGADVTELMWGMHFAIGSLVHFTAAGPLLAFISDGKADPEDFDGALCRLIRYTASGLRALAAQQEAAR